MNFKRRFKQVLQVLGVLVIFTCGTLFHVAKSSEVVEAFDGGYSITQVIDINAFDETVPVCFSSGSYQGNFSYTPS